FQLLLVSSAYWPPPAPMTVTASLRRGEADTAHPMAGRTLDRLPAIGPRRAGRWIGSVTLRLRVHAVGLRRGWAQRAAAHPATVTRQIRYASGFVGAAGALYGLADHPGPPPPLVRGPSGAKPRTEGAPGA